jgi:hypothetical protein
MSFEFWEGVNRYPFPIGFRNNYQTTKLSITSDSPYSYFKIQNDEGLTLYEAKSTYFVDDHKSGIFPRPQFLDFEILYIGQAMDDSEKPTFNRLYKHETLQEIYSKSSPDKEIFLFLFPLLSIDGVIETKNSVEVQPAFEKEDEERFRKFMDSKLILSRKQQVAVAEAALIRYFEPEYNKHHKDSFPTKRNSSYDELYKMDINTISIQVDTTPDEIYLFTKKAKSTTLHSESFFLPTEDDRRKLFDFSD